MVRRLFERLTSAANPLHQLSPVDEGQNKVLT